MKHSPETMAALADAYSSALRDLISNAHSDGFWFGADHVTHRTEEYTSLDLNWGEVASSQFDGGYREIFEAGDLDNG